MRSTTPGTKDGPDADTFLFRAGPEAMVAPLIEERSAISAKRSHKDATADFSSEAAIQSVHAERVRTGGPTGPR